MGASRYPANFIKGSLPVPESRIIAGLLLKRLSNDEWRQALYIDNVPQKRTPNTISTQAGLLRNRLETMRPPLWEIVQEGNREAAAGSIPCAWCLAYMIIWRNTTKMRFCAHCR